MTAEERKEAAYRMAEAIKKKQINKKYMSDDRKRFMDIEDYRYSIVMNNTTKTAKRKAKRGNK